MATIRIHDSDRVIDNASEQVAFLERYNIGFEQWDVSRLSTVPKSADTEEAHILDVFTPEIERLKASHGYQSADVIALKPTTPNLDALLGKFDKEHFHAEDEVRFVVKGRGVFTIHNDDDDIVFDVEVTPGDLLVVPEGTWHWFTLCEDRTIQCIRLFESTEGWAPNYRHAG